MVDSLGFRLKLGIIAPSTNTSVQPEMDAMRPYGVTNHFGRLYIPDDPINNDDDFNQLMANIRATMEDAARAVMTCQPHRLVLGMSSETFWDGLEGSKRLMARMSRSGRWCAGDDRGGGGTRRARSLRQHSSHRSDHALYAGR